MDRNRILSRAAIESLIAHGHTIVISENRVLKLDRWREKHPGGKLAVDHMVGHDATDEINAYHSLAALRSMDAYRIGRIAYPWKNFTPPIRGGVFRKNPPQESENSDDGDGSSTESDSDASLLGLELGLVTSRASSNTSLETVESSTEALKEQNSRDVLLKVPSPSHHATGPGGARYRAGRNGDRSSEASKCTQTREEYALEAMQKEIYDNLAVSPSLDPATQGEIISKYQALHERVKNEGFYDCRYTEYLKEAIRYGVLFSVFLLFLRAKWYLTSAACLGFFWHQIMFTAHDAGHRGITHNFVFDTLIGVFIADLCCGLSIGWWKSSHNVHHLIPNHPDHDPDIQNVPLFATCPSQFNSTHSSYYNFTFAWDAFADLAVRYQRYTYYPVMGIARFNLYLLSWCHLLSPRSANLGSAAWTRYAELLGMCVYWYLFGYRLLWCTIPTWPLRVAFVLVSHIITMPLHVQITLSHWGMPTADLGDGESFAQRQLRTTMDIDCPQWLDWIHGGLQFQAIHHLFPRVPRHNLRRLQTLVREFCKETGIKYHIYGFVDGNKEVLGRLDEVSRQVEMLIKCQAHMAATGESGLH